MFDKLRKTIWGAAPVPSAPAVVPPPNALVPLQSGAQMGALESMPDSTRPTLLPAPALRSFDEEARRSWMPATAHARHLTSVSGYLAYGLELNCAWMVGGDGLRLNLSPDHIALGWTPDEAASWAREAEKLFADWGNDAHSCDASGRMKFGAMQSAAVRSYLLSGDTIATLDYGPKRGAFWRTSVNLIDPARVITPMSHRYGVTFQQGIELDDRGRPLAYHVRGADRFSQPVRMPVWGSNGRRLVCHCFDGDAGTVRGMSPLASAVGGILQAMSAADAAVLSAHIAAAIMGTLTSDFPSDSVMQAFRANGPQEDALRSLMEHRIGWHEGLKKSNSDLQLGHGAKVVHLATGERFELHAGQKPFGDYDTILKHGLREAARALGLSYEALTSDKSQATYSSLKYSTTETRSIVERRRKAIVEPFCEWALDAVIEEAVANGLIDFKQTGPQRKLTKLKAFREMKRYALRAEWIGPAIPDPDELKSAKAAQLRVQSGLSSLSDEISAMGRDPDTTLDRIAADKQRLRERGLGLPQFETGRRASRPSTEQGKSK